MARRLLCVAVGMAVGLVLIAAPVTATSAAATKIWFKLREHEVQAGNDVTGTVLVLTKGRFFWWPLPRAPLTVSVDGVPVSSATTNFLGLAKIKAPAPPSGGHTIEVSYAGDATHQPAKASQAFTVLGEPPPPPAGVPDAPANLTGETPATGLVYLQWTIPADNGSPITGYRVYRGTTSGQLTFLDATGNGPPPVFSTDDVTADAGTTYYYVVTAVNDVGESAWSNEVAITAI